MRFITCLCGARIEGDGSTAIATSFWAHTDADHPEIKVSDARRTDIDEAIRRSGGWDGERERIDEGAIDVRPLTRALREQYLDYFDGPAFADNPVWARCYCLSYHLGESQETSDTRTAASNRADRAAQIERGDASGVLAFAGERIVGWCNASPRTSLPLLDATPGFGTDEPERTGAIVCYVIAPQYRGQGLATKLLNGACDLLRAAGLEWVDAYPPKEARSDASSYHGRLSMYLDAGFTKVRELDRYVVVRKEL